MFDWCSGLKKMDAIRQIKLENDPEQIVVWSVRKEQLGNKHVCFSAKGCWKWWMERDSENVDSMVLTNAGRLFLMFFFQM